MDENEILQMIRDRVTVTVSVESEDIGIRVTAALRIDGIAFSEDSSWTYIQ